MASGEVSALYKFSRLCDWLRRIEDLSSQTAPLSGGGGHAARGRQQRVSKQETVRALFREIREVGAKAGAPHADLHDFLRLLIPEEDKARAYKLQDKVFTELYITALQCGESTKQAMREWHARPQHAAAGGTVPLRGDIADVFSRLLQERHAHSAGLSVRELNARLDAFSAARVGAKGAGDTILTPLFRALDYREHKWLIRILLKNLKLGCKTDTILAAYHPSAGELFGQSASLVDVSRKCAAPGFVPTGAELQVFTPACAMLALGCTIEKAARKLASADFIVEDKLDGERVMVHFERSPARVEFWTRRRKDASAIYAPSMGAIVRAALAPSVTSAIVDGEMMVWDEEKGRHLEFGHNRQRSTAQGAHLHHALYAFDLLLLNGRSLLARPLAERRALLAQSVVCVPHRFETVEGETILRATRGGGGAAGGSGGASGVGGAGGGVAARIAERLNEAMGLGREGLMLKPLDSKYEPDSRGWLKIKPDYVAGAFRTLDVLIVGGYYGTAAAGRHWKSNGVSHFLLGLRAPLETAVASRTEHPPIFTFAKVGTGYGEEDLTKMRALLDPHAVKWTEPPPHLCGWKPSKADDRPDVWYPPAHSLVVELKAFELVRSDVKVWRAGLCLRFPRVQRVRYGKGPDDAATMDEVAALHDELCRTGRTLSNAGGARGEAGDADAEGGTDALGADAQPAAKRRKAAPIVLGGKLPASYVHDNLTVKADLFGGRELVVLTAADTRERLFLLAAQLGARLSVNVGARTELVIVDAELVLLGDDGARRSMLAQRRALDQTAVLLVRAARAFAAARADGPSGAAGGAADGGALNGSPKARGAGGGKARATGAGAPSFERLDIVTSDWLEACGEAGELVPIEPRHALHMSDRTAAAREQLMDEWGDRYAQPATATELRAAMALVRQQRTARAGAERAEAGARDALAPAVAVRAAMRDALLDDAGLLRLDPPPHGALRHPRLCVALVPAEFGRGVPGAEHPLRGCLGCAAVELRLLGATVVRDVCDIVTTVVLPDDAAAAARAARELRAQFTVLHGTGALVHAIVYVQAAWVDACRRDGGWADETPHLVAP